MFHADTQFLITHWTGLARRPQARGGIPARTALAPEALGGRLNRAFVLDEAGPHARFRLAGSWLESLSQRPLAGRPFGDMWCDSSPALVFPALARSVREVRPFVVTAQVDGGGPAAEVCLAPLRATTGEVLILGLVAASAGALPGSAPRRLVARLSVAAGETIRPPLRLVSSRRSA